jgi:pimeloyl-ACP methyl ester carboxylesterase
MPSVDAGGTELYYERAGTGEPMLLIQGMAATHLAWGGPFLDLLERDFEYIVYDHRGMGNSARAEMPFTIVDLAADALALLDALELETVHVVGISMGGMIAQELALAHPERIRTLTIGASYCGGPGGTLMDPEDLGLLGEAWKSGDPVQVYRAMWVINLSPAFRADDSNFDPFREMAEALPAPAPVIYEQMRASSRHDTSERLGRLEMPTMVIHGTADRLLKSPNGEQIAALVGVEPQLLDGVGHLFWWEQPERSAELIRQHAMAPA